MDILRLSAAMLQVLCECHQFYRIFVQIPSNPGGWIKPITHYSSQIKTFSSHIIFQKLSLVLVMIFLRRCRLDTGEGYSCLIISIKVIAHTPQTQTVTFFGKKDGHSFVAVVFYKRVVQWIINTYTNDVCMWFVTYIICDIHSFSSIIINKSYWWK